MHTQTFSYSDLHPVISQLLEKRGYNLENFSHFFSWNLKELPDLLALKDLEKASLKIIEAIEQKKKIGVYGDYDVDGTTSCALLYHFFKLLDIEVELFQPSRFVEGYGIHPSSVEAALEKEIEVLISVDCGISNIETAQYAQERGLCLIITDHHKDAAEIIPPAFAVINPNRRDEAEDSPLRVLAGVGVAFALALSLKTLWEKKNKTTIPSLYPLLQFVAIGTISDLAKLSPMNLKLVRHGLKQLPRTEFIGLRCFFPPEEREMPMALSEKISFEIGPMINSKGRLDHPELALRLLIETDSNSAYHYHQQLKDCNTQRKHIQRDVFNQAKDQIVSQMESPYLSSIVYHQDWHEGVIGIVASKLVETFKVPAIVFTDSAEEGIIKASARSAGDLDLFKALEYCKKHFLKFGGHKAAAGLSMLKENFPNFKKEFNQYLKPFPEILRKNQNLFDLELDFDQIGKDLAKQLESMEPFGMDNERPLFKIRNLSLDSYTILKDAHIKWFFTKKNSKQKVQGISFYYFEKWENLNPEDLFQNAQGDISIIAQLGINRFKGQEYLQLLVSDIQAN